jgi:hypothetical protein
VVNNDSALGLLRMIREAAKSRVDDYEAYARVLLDWHTHGKFWIQGAEDEVSVESLLLEALKTVTDPDLRRRIEEALTAQQRSIYLEKRDEKCGRRGKEPKASVHYLQPIREYRKA